MALINKLSAIGDAIREKTGKEDLIKLDDMPTEISNLANVSIEDKLLDGSLIGEYTNNRITVIRGHAFRGLNINTVNSETVTQISDYAFYGATVLQKCNMPNVTQVGTQSFVLCNQLQRLEFPKLNTSILVSAFANNPALTYINLGKATIISNAAFSGCDAIETIILLKDDGIVSLKHSNAFSNSGIAAGTGFIYVPDALVDNYKTATNWSTYAEQIKPLSELEDTL